MKDIKPEINELINNTLPKNFKNEKIPKLSPKAIKALEQLRLKYSGAKK